MITFAQPLALLALLALPILIALHMLRPQRRRVVVSSNALWREALRVRESGAGLRRLPRDLGLWLALAIALAMALAVARPGWETRTAASSDTVVVIDSSASMQAGDRMDAAREAATQFASDLPDSARVALIASSARPRLLAGFDASRESYAQQLGALDATDEAGDPGRAIAFALSLLRTRDAGRVVFFTDGAFAPVADVANVDIRSVGQPLANLGLTRFEVRPLVDRPDHYEALVSVHNFSDTAVSLPLRIEAARTTVSELDLDLAADSEQTVVVPLRGRLAGPATARIEVDDGLERDNTAYAVIPADQPLRIAYLGTPNADLASALAAQPAVSVESQPANDAQALSTIARRFDVVLANGIDLPALPAGSFLLVNAIPNDFVFADAGSIERPVITGRGRSVLLRDIDLRGVSVGAARRIQIDGSATGVTPLLWARDDVLALAAIEGGRRAVYLGFDVSRSTLPTTAALPLFVDHALQWLRPRTRRHAATQIIAGEPWALGTIAQASEVIVRLPDGAAEVLEPGQDLVFEDTSRSGIYSFTVNGVASHVAVNIGSVRESDLRPLDHARPSPSPEVPDMQASRLTAPLWAWLALLGLGLAMIDWILRLRGQLGA